ncbi:hypothetical protein GGR56DRAFT_646034 [Xylariaceae sp. FL0804]|nr:hypothetical protein GGR56DRAFT_646034 [Xylariaceae sp. FL0804]
MVKRLRYGSLAEPGRDGLRLGGWACPSLAYRAVTQNAVWKCCGTLIPRPDQRYGTDQTGAVSDGGPRPRYRAPHAIYHQAACLLACLLAGGRSSDGAKSGRNRGKGTPYRCACDSLGPETQGRAFAARNPRRRRPLSSLVRDCRMGVYWGPGSLEEARARSPSSSLSHWRALFLFRQGLEREVQAGQQRRQGKRGRQAAGSYAVAGQLAGRYMA